MICSLKPKDVEKKNSIPPCPTNVFISMIECEKEFKMSKDKCQEKMAEKWLKIKKASLPKIVG